MIEEKKQYKFEVSQNWEGSNSQKRVYTIRLQVGSWVESKTVSSNIADLKTAIAQAKLELAKLYDIFESEFPSLTEGAMKNSTINLPRLTGATSEATVRTDVENKFAW